MAAKNLEQLVEEVITRQAGNTAILLGYFEHQVDLLTKVVKDLSGLADPTKITPEIQERLDNLDVLLTQSSIDFTNLSSPLQSYKLPGTVEKKRIIRDVQARYLEAKLAPAPEPTPAP